ncbi:hypothetical protein [Paraburkholderia caledonica]|uniref:hypothetical protein n=1 Tax=Paraburkholderia caledonica TaxID=134536 RepID=UPI0015C5CF77|nr:hypothetical protein [Paraburkholderia caledonica]
MNIAHATISGTMKAPKAKGIGRATVGKAVDIKRRLWHCSGNEGCDARWIALERQKADIEPAFC